MGIPDPLTCFLTNLHAGQEATVELDMEQQTGSKLLLLECSPEVFQTEPQASGAIWVPGVPAADAELQNGPFLFYRFIKKKNHIWIILQSLYSLSHLAS